MDRFTAMTAFVAVAEHRGFAAAARRLGLSPPAVTRLVAWLEDQLAIRLLHRTTRAVALTDAGARYLAGARRILTDLDEAERAARAERVVPSGRLAIAAPTMFGRLEVAPVACELRARHPALAVDLALADRIVDLVDAGLDVAVRIGALADSSLRIRPVGATRRVVAGSPAYFAAHPPPRTPADLRRHAIIHPTGTAPAPEWRFVRGGQTTRLALTPVLTATTIDAAIELAVRGGGLVHVFAYQVRALVRAGALRVVLARHEVPAVPIQIVHPGGRLVSAAVRAFIELAAARDWRFVDL
jgi:DNA-binding transcriptional LysR family regulator